VVVGTCECHLSIKAYKRGMMTDVSARQRSLVVEGYSTWLS